MSLSDESFKGKKKTKTMSVLEGVYLSWGAMIKYVKEESKDDTAAIANLIDILVKAHQLPFDGRDDKFTVEKLLQQNELTDNMGLMEILIIQYKFVFPTESIKDLLPSTSFERLLSKDLISCDDPLFVKYIRSSEDGGTKQLTKMLKKSDNFAACGRILAAFLKSDDLEQMLTFIKKLMPQVNTLDIQGSVDELSKKLNCSVENKTLIDQELIKEWKLTTKGKVNKNELKRKTSVGGESNKKKTKIEDKEDYVEEDDFEEDDSSEDDSGEDDSGEDDSGEDDSGEDFSGEDD